MLVVFTLVSLALVGWCQARPEPQQEIGNIDNVVQTVSRLARSLELPAETNNINVRVPRQIGGGPPGPPGPYRSRHIVSSISSSQFDDFVDKVTQCRMISEMISTSKRQATEGLSQVLETTFYCNIALKHLSPLQVSILCCCLTEESRQ